MTSEHFGGAQKINWEAVIDEYAMSFPALTREEIAAKHRALGAEPAGIIAGTQRMLAWAVGTSLQRMLKR